MRTEAQDMKKHLWKKSAAILAAAVFITSLFTGCGKGYRHISHEEAAKMMEKDKSVIVVDVRGKDEYDKQHIPGAILVPIEDIREGRLDAIPDKNATVLLYCWTGRRSEDSAEMLANYGYKHVYEFGGLVDWDGAVEVDDAPQKAAASP